MFKWLSFRIKVLLIVIILVVIAGTMGFAIVEGLSVFNAFYFTMITMATVGYGDIHPVTDAGKIISILLILGGTGSLLALFATITETLVSGEEKAEKRNKINMTVGIFFSEVGNDLMASIPCENTKKVEERLLSITRWSNGDFDAAKKEIGSMDFKIDARKIDMKGLGKFISAKRDFLMRILENPNLLEHETFSDLLQSVFHLSRELEVRKGAAAQAADDHIREDIKAVYLLLVKEWIEYMRYLKFNYPHFFSFMATSNRICKVQ